MQHLNSLKLSILVNVLTILVIGVIIWLTKRYLLAVVLVFSFSRLFYQVKKYRNEKKRS